MAKSSTLSLPSESIATWYRETVARIFGVPVDGEFVRHYTERVTESELGMIVDRLDLRGDPAMFPSVTHHVLYWVYEQRLRQEILERALNGSFLITGCDEKFLTLESRNTTLATMPYADYLNTVHWQSVRIGALDRADYRCQMCNSPDELHVQHRTYARRGHEAPDDLTVLCKDCHSRFHEVTDGVATRMPVSP